MRSSLSFALVLSSACAALLGCGGSERPVESPRSFVAAEAQPDDTGDPTAELVLDPRSTFLSGSRPPLRFGLPSAPITAHVGVEPHVHPEAESPVESPEQVEIIEQVLEADTPEEHIEIQEETVERQVRDVEGLNDDLEEIIRALRDEKGLPDEPAYKAPTEVAAEAAQVNHELDAPLITQVVVGLRQSVEEAAAEEPVAEPPKE